MGLKTFKGGVHPKDGKELSKSKPIKEYRLQVNWYFRCHSTLVHRLFRLLRWAILFWKGRRLRRPEDLFCAGVFFCFGKGESDWAQARGCRWYGKFHRDREWREFYWGSLWGNGKYTELSNSEIIDKTKKPVLWEWEAQVSRHMSSFRQRSRKKSSILSLTVRNASLIWHLITAGWWKNRRNS